MLYCTLPFTVGTLSVDIVCLSVCLSVPCLTLVENGWHRKLKIGRKEAHELTRVTRDPA